jgi:hypothetical protein
MNPDTQSVAELEALLLAKLIQQMKKNFEEKRADKNEVKTEELIEGAKENLSEKEKGQLKMILEDPVKFDKAISSVETTYYKELSNTYFKEQKLLEGYKEVSQTDNEIEYESIKDGSHNKLTIKVDSQQEKIQLIKTYSDMVKEDLVTKTKPVQEISFKELESNLKQRQNEQEKGDKKLVLHMEIEGEQEQNEINQDIQKEAPQKTVSKTLERSSEMEIEMD